MARTGNGGSNRSGGHDRGGSNFEFRGPGIDPKRLCDAAEAALLAAVEGANKADGRWAYPPDLMGTSAQPKCLAGFTRDEIEQATRFLRRLGMLDNVQSKRGAA